MRKHAGRVDGQIRLVAIGAGCSGTPAVPIMAATPPALGGPGFMLTVDDAAPSAIGAIGLAPRHQPNPIRGGCVFQLGGTVFPLAAVTYAFGHADAVPIPLDPALRGLACSRRASSSSGAARRCGSRRRTRSG